MKVKWFKLSVNEFNLFKLRNDNSVASWMHRILHGENASLNNGPGGRVTVAGVIQLSFNTSPIYVRVFRNRPTIHVNLKQLTTITYNYH